MDGHELVLSRNHEEISCRGYSGHLAIFPRFCGYVPLFESRSEREKAFLLASAPDNKFGLNLNYDRKWFNAGLAFTRFSEVKLLDYQMHEDVAGYGSFAEQIKAATDTYGAKIVTDLTLGFQLQKHTKLSIGANNLFNIYPDQQDDWVEAGGYWDAVQMGFSGAYYYARLGFNF